MAIDRARNRVRPGCRGKGPSSTRVLHVIDSLDGGGAERVLLTLIRGLTPRGVHQAVFLLYKEGALFDLLEPSCKVYRADGDTMVSLARAVGDFRPDVIHSWMDDAAIAAAPVAAAAGVPFVHRVPHIPSAQYDVHPRGPGYLDRLRLALGAAAEVCALSGAAADDARAFLRVPVARVIYNGFPLVAGPPAQPLRKPAGSLLVTAVGRLAEEKGHRHLVAAMARIAARHPRVRCWIAGTGPLEAPLRAQIRRLGLDGIVSLQGFHGNVEPLLAATDVFVLPSLYEGFGNALVEALRAGCCVVASDLPVVRREIVRAPDAAWLCRPGSSDDIAEALGRLLEDPSARAAMGRAARQSASAFALAHMVAGFGRLYADLGEGHRDRYAA